jgi:hypothetical protein
MRDANRDGRLGLVCRFLVQDMGFQPGDIQGFLRGQTVVGQDLWGSAPVQIKWPTTQEEDDVDTQLDLEAWEGDVLLWLPVVAK